MSLNMVMLRMSAMVLVVCVCALFTVLSECMRVCTCPFACNLKVWSLVVIPCERPVSLRAGAAAPTQCILSYAPTGVCVGTELGTS